MRSTDLLIPMSCTFFCAERFPYFLVRYKAAVAGKKEKERQLSRKQKWEQGKNSIRMTGDLVRTSSVTLLYLNYFCMIEAEGEKESR